MKASRITQSNPICEGKLKSIKGIKRAAKILKIPTKKVYDFGLAGPFKTILSPKEEKAKNRYDSVIVKSQSIFVFVL
jgi:hypothetical protein